MKTMSVEKVRSADGTMIALEAAGSGRPVVLVGGAFNDRKTTAGLAQVIAGSNTLPWLAAAAEEVARVVPGARHLSLGGQDHSVIQQPDALLDSLRAFLG